MAGASRWGEENHDTYALIIRVDADGNEIWQRVYDDGNRGDFLVDIVETPDGGFAAAQEYRGHGRRFILRVDCNGDVLWRWRGLFADDEDSHAILRLDDGGYLLVGNSTAHTAILIRTEPDPAEFTMELAAIDTVLEFGEVKTDSAAFRDLRLTNPVSYTHLTLPTN